MQDLVVAITGASGSIYAVRLLEILLTSGHNVHVTISPAAVQVLHHELGLHVDLDNFDSTQLLPDEAEVSQDSALGKLRRPTVGSEFAVSSVFNESDLETGQLHYHHYEDFFAGIASGSFLTGGMVICPCSMGTLGSLANGHATNLIHRAAEVHLKERRKLIVVPRETPTSGWSCYRHPPGITTTQLPFTI
jgi:4-hydroxy-3-polyprenylbenzoate decarboxylase